MTYSVFGSDARQIWLAALLAADGKAVTRTGQTVSHADTLILPVPTLSAGGLIRGSSVSFSQLLAEAPAGCTIWGNGLHAYDSAAAQRRIRLRCFSDYPAFAEQNAVPTAEGAVQLAMEELPVTICGGKFLVIGYGRIGSKLAAMLDALGGIVTVARREPTPLPYRVDRTGDYHTALFAYDAVFNTVPAPVFRAEHCEATKADCLLIDLASAPGGISGDCGRKRIAALGLPAKTAPKTAAQIMKNLILSETEEST